MGADDFETAHYLGQACVPRRCDGDNQRFASQQTQVSKIVHVVAQ
jgi:hypothetical protein